MRYTDGNTDKYSDCNPNVYANGDRNCHRDRNAADVTDSDPNSNVYADGDSNGN